MTSPLLALKKTAEEVASGKFKTRADVWADDEIGALAGSINQMIDNFVNIQESLSKTNKQLSIINHIALATEQAGEIHDVLYSILEKILTSVGLDYGWIYLYDPELGKHHLASWANIPPPLENILLHQEHSELCSCQQLLAAGELGEQVIRHQCSRIKHPVSHSSHLTIPIIEDDTPFGLINLYCADEQWLDGETYELLNTIGVQVSKMVANAWLQLKLREKEVARQALLESLVTAQENERQRLARELHDQAGQTLTSLLIRLKTIEQKTEEAHSKADLLAT
ncbi:HAMP domain-containing protein [Chloroflexota bacterium]